MSTDTIVKTNKPITDELAKYMTFIRENKKEFVYKLNHTGAAPDAAQVVSASSVAIDGSYGIMPLAATPADEREVDVDIRAVMEANAERINCRLKQHVRRDELLLLHKCFFAFPTADETKYGAAKSKKQMRKDIADCLLTDHLGCTLNINGAATRDDLVSLGNFVVERNINKKVSAKRLKTVLIQSFDVKSSGTNVADGFRLMEELLDSSDDESDDEDEDEEGDDQDDEDDEEDEEDDDEDDEDINAA